MYGIALGQCLVIYKHGLIAKADFVARESNHAFYEMLRGINRVVKNHDVSAFQVVVRHEPVPNSTLAKMDFVYKKIIANQERFLHGLRRDLKCLHNERDHE